MAMAESGSRSADAPLDLAAEADLVAALRRGDDRAYETLVRLYAARLLLVARRLMRVEEDARDAVQDAFVQAFRSIATFREGSRLYTWLHRIVINAALMKLRKRTPASAADVEALLPRFHDDGHVVNPSPDWRLPADALAERQELRAIVRRCIDDLPEEYRCVLMLRDIEELNTEETAQLLGMTTGAVKTRLHRARQALRTLLDPHLRGHAA